MAEYVWKLKASLELANVPTMLAGPAGTQIQLALRSNANLKATASTTG